MYAGDGYYLRLVQLIFGYFVVLYSVQGVLLIVSCIQVLCRPRRARLFDEALFFNSPVVPPVSLVVPAHNEETTIVASVLSLLNLRYPKLEVIVVNDGSADATLARLISAFNLRRSDLLVRSNIQTGRIHDTYLSISDPRLLVIDKAQRGKSDALNAGLNACRTPWVCCVDADSILERDALVRAMRPVVEDDRVVATSGIVRIVNGCEVLAGRVSRVALPTSSLTRFQVLEYLQDFLAGRVGWSRLNALMIISGAFGVFRTELLRELGGYSNATVTEDMELVLRLHAHCQRNRRDYKIVFVPDPVCWTEVPGRLADLRRQRSRWHRGLAEVLWQHRRVFLRVSDGRTVFVLLYLLLILFSPLVSTLAYPVLAFGFFTGRFTAGAAAYLSSLAFFVSTAFAIAAVLLEEMTFRRYTSWREFLTLIGYAGLQHFGYQQVLACWRIEGLWDFLRGRSHWGRQNRHGFGMQGGT